MAKPKPNNSATFTCVECGSPAPAHETWAMDLDGNTHLIHVDAWPTYYWDTLYHRDEFCSAACVCNFLKGTQISHET